MRKTTSFLDASFTLKLAPASVQAIIERAAQAGEKEYSVLKKKIKAARLLYIDFHLESWFTCIKIVGVQPTNNYAEQAIRTWQYQKLDIKKGLSRMLSANLC